MNSTVNEREKIYYDQIAHYDKMIEAIAKREEGILELIKNEEAGAAYKRMFLVDEMIFLSSIYLAKYEFSAAGMGVKNENILNEARKYLCRALTYLEETITPFVDVPYSDYEENTVQIANLTQKQRYYLIRKLGLLISIVSEAYGENKKWRWAFAEIRGRFAAVSKNILDLKYVTSVLMNPRDEDYDFVVLHLRLVKKLFQETSDEYRKKYELAGNNMTDFNFAIQFLSALRRMHLILNEQREAEEIKRKLDIWSGKMKKDRISKNSRR